MTAPTTHDPRLTLPMLPLRNGVLFPGTAITLPIGRRRSVALVRSVQVGDSIVVGVQRDRRIDEPSLTDLMPMATLSRVRSIVPVRSDQFRIVIEGIGRFHIQGLPTTNPTWRVEGRPAEETVANIAEARALAESLLERLKDLQPTVNDDLKQALAAASPRDTPGRVADVVAAALGLTTEQEAEVLLSLEVCQRLRIVHRLIAEAITFAEVKSKISREVHEEINKSQREAMLRQQLKAIQRELGDGDDDQIAQLKKRLDEVGLSEEARKVVDRETRRLENMGQGSPEQHIIRNYLELIADLPWNKRAEAYDDIDAVAQKLDADHYGLAEVKKRILEHLAVRKMTDNNKGAILCFVGPPGVGKTSLGQSIADATKRPFVRVALGAVRDEAEVRGHRRTYIGALPGRIIAGLRRAGVKNAVMLLDEVDKLGQGWMGSPEAALLEVLNPEQNHTFTDHYLELAFDLSEVFFICTANTLETLSGPLKDRLEIIEIEGYTLDEKLHIAKRHLLPKRLSEHGLTDAHLALQDSAITGIVSDYTREAGVRQLTREITKVCRAVTLDIARHPESKTTPVNIEAADLRTYLGKTKFFNEVAERTAIPGVATGLAWTPVGGDVLFIESSRMPGKGSIEITGQLGDVMKESARAALTYVRSHADSLGIPSGFLEQQDLHIHVPSGGVPKDGPSAGVTIFTALTSLFGNRRCRADTAMTGEVTLRGRVLPVGGIKSKVLAAHRAGIARIILPEKNRRDLDEVPKEIQNSLEFIFAEDMAQVLEAALEPSVTALPGAKLQAASPPL